MAMIYLEISIAIYCVITSVFANDVNMFTDLSDNDIRFSDYKSRGPTNGFDAMSTSDDNIRLTQDIKPVHYTVYLHPNITNGKFDLTGRVIILLEVNKETDSIFIHSKFQKFVAVGVREVVGHHYNIPVSGTVEHKKTEMIQIKLGKKLSVKRRYNLVIWFAGHLADGLKGFYKSSYKTNTNETRFIASTHFEATGARYAFPCFDEPEMKATFSIVMVRERIHSSLSNMPVEKQIERSDELIEDHFQKSVKMSTYLVAFVVSDFAHLSTTSKHGIKIRIWAPKDLIMNVKYALEITPKILDYYENFFRIPFPLPKQDLIAIPNFAMGAMENWGLITYRSTALLFDDKKSSTMAKQYVAIVIAHELAHQWFGNLCTMKWWNDIWLNEGFAQFVENIGTNVVGKTWGIMDQFVNDNNHYALALDSKINSHPISVAVKDPTEINALFDGISYSKGASVIRMMSDFIGAKRFLDGLASYLKKHEYGNAESDDLWEALSTATDNKINVKKIMDTWVLQMGYPLVTVKRDPDNNDFAILTQERFVSDVGKINTTKQSSSYRWEIPLTFYFQNNRTIQRKWLHTEEKSVRLPWSKSLGWLKVNVNEKGFYRVNYDTDNWKVLADQLKNKHTELSVTDRANLINDAFALANSDRISLMEALDMTKYLHKEKDYVPFSTALSTLNSIGKLLRHRPGYTFYKTYLHQQISPLVDELGWLDQGSHLNKLLRRLVLKNAVAYNMKRAMRNANIMYKEWMDEGKCIPANLLSIVFTAGIRYGTQKEWNFMFAKFRSSINPTEKNTYMYALAESSDPKILKRYLELTLNKKIIRSQDVFGVIRKIADNDIGTKLAQDFVKKNWDILLERCQSHIGGIVQAVFSSGRTKKELVEAKAFLKERELGSGKRDAKRVIANIRNNIIWLQRNEKAVEQWLTHNIHI